MQVLSVAACELLVVVRGIYLPDQGSNPGPLALGARVLATGPSEKFLCFLCNVFVGFWY